jgi:carbonic anhydrase
MCRDVLPAVLTLLAVFAASAAERAAPLDPEKALAALVQGNRRYQTQHLRHPHQNASRRVALTAGQHPFAAVLSCADSRVPPEIVFDQGLGDLFVVRVAGNITDDVVLGSLEYAVEHLHVPLVVVLGHHKCGAIQAAVEGGTPHDHVASLLAALKPSVEAVRPRGGDVVAHAVVSNVRSVAAQLNASEPVLHHAVAACKLRVVGAVYDLQTGKVELLH